MMAALLSNKRKFDEQGPKNRPSKSRKQKRYSSPSSSSAPDGEGDEFPAINLADSEEDDQLDSKAAVPSMLTQSASKKEPDTSSNSSISSSESDSETSVTRPNNDSNQQPKKLSKRNDPSVFASSISAILSSKLSTQKRSDPVLSRSATAQEANASIANSRLEAKAKRKMKEDKREALEKGRVRDVLLGTDRPQAATNGDDGNQAEGQKDLSVGELQEQERRLRKTAQRGVVKLFNAVRAAQVKAEEARAKGGSQARKEERVGEMSKQGFLDMVASGGNRGAKMSGGTIEEA